MRVAALYDIHGNLPALEAVLDEVRHTGVDRVIVGGDVLPGPMPRETLACLQGLAVPVQLIQGNGDRETLNLAKGLDAPSVPERYRSAMRWVADQLDHGHQQWLASWPATLRLEIGGIGRVLFCHATPRSDTEIFTRLTADEALREVFADAGADLVVCGHTHIQFQRTIGGTRIVNAGSVGMPFCDPGAYWLLLGPDVQLRRTAYDLETAADRIRRTAYPDADDFAARNVLHPPSEEETLAAFSRVELQ